MKILGRLNMGTWSKYGPILFKFSIHIERFREGLKAIEFERDSIYIVSFIEI